MRDAVYRGTLVCDKLPFTLTRMREAIEVTISAGTVRYTHVVRLRDAARGCRRARFGHAQWPEHQPGRVRERRQTSEYKAKYSGTFVRRSARLTGTQTWNDGGKTIARACSGAIKRPLRLFLPRDKKP